MKMTNLQHDLETYGHDKSVDSGASFFGEEHPKIQIGQVWLKRDANNNFKGVFIYDGVEWVEYTPENQKRIYHI